MINILIKLNSTNVETFTNNVDNLVEVNIPAFVPPTFSLVLPSRKRYILVLDVSKRMGDENGFDRRWEKTRNALFLNTRLTLLRQYARLAL